MLGVGSFAQMSENVVFGSNDTEWWCECIIKQMCATNRCVADRQLFQYNFNDSIAVF